MPGWITNYGLTATDTMRNQVIFTRWFVTKKERDEEKKKYIKWYNGKIKFREINK